MSGDGAESAKRSPQVRERPLGPFSDVVCWFKGHEWEETDFLTHVEYARCWRLKRGGPRD